MHRITLPLLPHIYHTYLLTHSLPSILYIVKKQQYLESLCWQGSKMRAAHLPWRPPHAKKSATAGSAAAEEPEQELLNLDYICDLLKSLEPLCPNHKEYNSLLTNLTLEALTDNPDYKDWCVFIFTTSPLNTIANYHVIL